MKFNEFLKELLGDEVYSTVEVKLNESKAKFVDLADGQYVDKNKYDALKTQTDTMADKVKSFDGVDVQALKDSAASWETKYNEDINKIKMDHAVSTALVGSKNMKAVKALLNMENVKLDGDSLIGLKEQLETLKSSDPYLFESEQPKATGVKMGVAAEQFTKAQINKMSTAEINANWSKPEFQEALK